MKDRIVWLMIMGICLAVTAQAQVITSVVREGGASGDRDPIGAYNSTTTPLMDTLGDPDNEYAFSDRTYPLINNPAEMIGHEFVRTFNSDKGNSGVTYDVTISSLATVWITIDGRFNSGDHQSMIDAATANIGPAGTFTYTGIDLTLRERSNGSRDRAFKVYSADLDVGTYRFVRWGSSSNNFYLLGANLKDITANPAPVVDAGPDQSTYIGDTVQLAGAATDEGPLNGTSPGSPGGVQSSFWYPLSGPGLVNFSNPGIMDPTVTFSAKGVYELVLQVSDIEPKYSSDIVVITVKDHADEFIVGHWPLDGDALDYSVNSNDGTLEGLEGDPDGMPTYTTDAAIGSHSIDLTDVIGLNAINNHDPNLKYVDLGAATELDFGTTDWTVSGWVKTTHTGTGDINKGTIFGNGGDTGGGHRYCLIVSESGEGRTMLVTDDNSTKHTIQDGGPDNDGLWHFIVGQREGSQLRVYRDGVLEASKGISASYDLSGTSQANSYIGVITDWGTPTTIYKHLDGQIDDVRVYNYALPLDDATYPSILGLTATGPIVATVDAGGDFTINWKPTTPAVGLAGSIVDIGKSPVTSGLWTTIAGPDDGLGGFVEATFTDGSDSLSTVTFPAAGVYTLQLEVFDADAVDPGVPGSGYVSDAVVVTAIAPTCADVILDGLLSKYDFDSDCYVGLEDFIVVLNDYLKCNDPLDATCPWPAF